MASEECVDVIIVGGGVAGCSAAWHLTKAGVNVILLECGNPGDGNKSSVAVPTDTFTREGDLSEPNNAFEFAGRSGTAVLPTCETVKMMLSWYASSSEDFIRHHGREGARRYLKLADEGIKIEKELARAALTDVNNDIRCLGSLYVAYKEDREDFLKEFEYLQSLGCRDIELWDTEKVQQASGGKCANFDLGIYFPHDAIINSAKFCKDLLSLAKKSNSGSLTVLEGCSAVKSLAQNGSSNTVTVSLSDGSELSCRQAVVATGGLFLPPTLTGILKPCWSYLVGIPIDAGNQQSDSADQLSVPLPQPNSMNFITWGFTHDWACSGGFLRISGEDHFSALKPPRMQERCRSLAQWTYEKYPHLLPRGVTDSVQAANCCSNFNTQYGVYSETPDSAPLVGSLVQESRIFYCLGCNALGQACLSYAASLLPALMGVRGCELSEEQRDLFELLTIRRFCLLPGNR